MYVHLKNSKHLLSHSRAIMALDHSRLGLENKFLENKSGRIFLRSTGLLYKFLPTNLRVCKPTFYTFYTSHLRWNSTIYHTDLGQNAVFHNFSRQTALSQYSGRSIVGFYRNRLAGSHFWQPPNKYYLQCKLCRVFDWTLITLIELRFNKIKNLLCSFFYLTVL